MTTEVELTQDEFNQVSAFVGEKPSEHEELLHKMWFNNALARYYLYVLKNTHEALRLTNQNIEEMNELFSQDFTEEDREKKSILFILALNVVRLSYYQNNIPLCKIQTQELKTFIFQNTKIKENIFPKNLTLLLNKYGPKLISDMTEEDFDYYRLKLAIVESKLQDNLLESFEQHVDDNPAGTAFLDYDKNIRSK